MMLSRAECLSRTLSSILSSILSTVLSNCWPAFGQPVWPGTRGPEWPVDLSMTFQRLFNDLSMACQWPVSSLSEPVGGPSGSAKDLSLT